MKTICGWRLTVAIFFVPGVVSLDAGPYTLTDLGTLGGSGSTANAINNSGQVVGSSYVPNNVERAFLYSGGVMHSLLAACGESLRQRGLAFICVKYFT